MFHKLREPPADAPVITVDGRSVPIDPGESVAAVLLRLEPPMPRVTPVKGTPRAPYCLMGVCFDCLAVVDGIASTRTCLVTAAAGMRVERQVGRPVLADGG